MTIQKLTTFDPIMDDSLNSYQIYVFQLKFKIKKRVFS